MSQKNPDASAANSRAGALVHQVWPWLAAIATGLALTLCFPRWNLGALCWISLVPLICAIWFGSHRRWDPVLLGYAAGLTFFWCAFSWLQTVTELGWFVLAFYMALYFAFWGGVLALIRPLLNPRNPAAKAGPFLSSRRNLLVAFLAAATWVAHEYIRGVLFSGFGWNNIGVALHRDLPMIQIADLTGAGGLSFLVVFSNVMIVLTVRRLMLEIGRVTLRPHYDFSASVALVALTFGYGVRAMLQPVETKPLRVALIQPNIPQEQKWDPAYEDAIFASFAKLTQIASVAEPELVVWPEASTPRGMFADQRNYDFVRAQAAAGDYHLLLGSLDFDETGADYNVAVMLGDRGETVEIYQKMHLVPFGEYIPLRKSFPLFAMIIGDLVPADFTPGRDFKLFPLRDVQLAPLICFEDTLGDLTRQFVRRGAHLLVNITNDGWFLKSAGAEQHLANAILRTVENRRPMVRSANTGVSAFIDHAGRVRLDLRDAKRSHLIEGVLTGEVQIPAKAWTTFYTRNGEIFSYAMCAVTGVTLGGFLFDAWKRRRGRAK